MGSFSVPGFSTDRHDSAGTSSNSQTSGVMLDSHSRIKSLTTGAIVALSLLALYNANAQSDTRLQAAVQDTNSTQTHLLELQSKNSSTAQVNSAMNTPVEDEPNTDPLPNPVAANVSVKVNGEEIAIPTTGSASQEVITPSGASTTVSVTQGTDGMGIVTSSSNSGTKIRISGSSESSFSSETETRVRIRE